MRWSRDGVVGCDCRSSAACRHFDEFMAGDPGDRNRRAVEEPDGEDLDDEPEPTPEEVRQRDRAALRRSIRSIAPKGLEHVAEDAIARGFGLKQARKLLLKSLEERKADRIDAALGLQRAGRPEVDDVLAEAEGERDEDLVRALDGLKGGN